MISVVIPALNEEGAIGKTIAELQSTLGQAGLSGYEIIVVDDGSSDRTNEIASSIAGVRVIRHLHNIGYGGSLKHGIREAAFDTIVIIDADGSYPVREIPAILTEYRRGFDLVIGSRS